MDGFTVDSSIRCYRKISENEADKVDSRYEELLKENMLLKSSIVDLEKKYASVTAEKEALWAAIQQVSRIISGI